MVIKSIEQGKCVSSAVNIYFKYLLDFLDNIKAKRN